MRSRNRAMSTIARVVVVWRCARDQQYDDVPFPHVTESLSRGDKHLIGWQHSQRSISHITYRNDVFHLVSYDCMRGLVKNVPERVFSPVTYQVNGKTIETEKNKEREQGGRYRKKEIEVFTDARARNPSFLFKWIGFVQSYPWRIAKTILLAMLPQNAVSPHTSKVVSPVRKA